MTKPFFTPDLQATDTHAADAVSQSLILAQANLNAITDLHYNAPEGQAFICDTDTIMQLLWSAQTYLEQLGQAFDRYTDLHSQEQSRRRAHAQGADHE